MNLPPSSRPDEPPAQASEPTPTPSAGPAVPDFEPVRIPPAILEAQAAFERDLPRLLKERPGQWVAYRPEGPILFAADSFTLHQECRRRGYWAAAALGGRPSLASDGPGPEPSAFGPVPALGD
jgi:hypothetical protein